MFRTGAAMAACAVMMGGLGAPAAAQEYPTRTITLVVGYAAGGFTDQFGRMVAAELSSQLGQKVVVENKPSAGGILGPEQVKNANPDGYTILIHHIGMAVIPTLYRQLRFDPLKDFEYIGLVNEVPMTIIGKPGFQPNNAQELVSYMKANKDKVTYANAGIGAASHLCGMLFMSAIGVDVLTVPYKGTGPTHPDFPETVRIDEINQLNAIGARNYQAPVAQPVPPPCPYSTCTSN